MDESAGGLKFKVNSIELLSLLVLFCKNLVSQLLLAIGLPLYVLKKLLLVVLLVGVIAIVIVDSFALYGMLIPCKRNKIGVCNVKFVYGCFIIGRIIKLQNVVWSCADNIN